MAQIEEVKVSTGSEMNGLDDIDLVEFAGLSPLTDLEHDKLYGEATAVSILEDCWWADFEWQDEDDIEDIPLYTDRYFTVYTTDIEKLKEELRTLIQDKLNTPA